MMWIEVELKGYSRSREGRWPPLQIAPAKSENGIGNTENHDGENRPDEHHDDGVGAAQPERAAPQRQRQYMQDRKAGDGVGHHQGGADDQRQDREQSAGEAERERDR